EEEGLLFFGAEAHDRRAHRVDRHEGERGARPTGLVEEDELVGGGATLAAELLGPSDAEPAVLADAPDDLAPQLATLAHLADALADLVGEQFGVVRAQFLAQGQLLGGFLQEHGAVLPPVRAGSPG